MAGGPTMKPPIIHAPMTRYAPRRPNLAQASRDPFVAAACPRGPGLAPREPEPVGPALDKGLPHVAQRASSAWAVAPQLGQTIP